MDIIEAVVKLFRMLPYYKVGPFWAVCKKKYVRERCLWNEAAKKSDERRGNQDARY